MTRLRSLLLLGFVAGLGGCDHVTKHVAERELSARGPVTLLRGVLDLRLVENRDTAFSLTRDIDWSGKTPALGVLALLGCAVVAGAAWRRRKVATGLEQLGYALVIAGGLGNGLDRILRGYVVDFIHLHHWPIFNAADVFVVLGAAALLFGMKAPARPASTAA